MQITYWAGVIESNHCAGDITEASHCSTAIYYIVSLLDIGFIYSLFKHVNCCKEKHNVKERWWKFIFKKIERASKINFTYAVDR